MDVDSLYLLVSEAIQRADALSDLGAPGAASASIDVSMLEEKIAEQFPATTPEGALARRGAVRAATAAGDVERAARLIERFCSGAGASDELRDELRAMLPTASAALSRRREVIAARFPAATARYSADEIARLIGDRARQAAPLPIG